MAAAEDPLPLHSVRPTIRVKKNGLKGAILLMEERVLPATAWDMEALQFVT